MKKRRQTDKVSGIVQKQRFGATSARRYPASSSTSGIKTDEKALREEAK
jgi:hypothetical protein